MCKQGRTFPGFDLEQIGPTWTPRLSRVGWPPAAYKVVTGPRQATRHQTTIFRSKVDAPSGAGAAFVQLAGAPSKPPPKPEPSSRAQVKLRGRRLSNARGRAVPKEPT